MKARPLLGRLPAHRPYRARLVAPQFVGYGLLAPFGALAAPPSSCAEKRIATESA